MSLVQKNFCLKPFTLNHIFEKYLELKYQMIFYIKPTRQKAIKVVSAQELSVTKNK